MQPTERHEHPFNSLGFQASGLRLWSLASASQSQLARLHESDQPPACEALNSRCRHFQP